MVCIWNLLYDIIDDFVLYFYDSFPHLIFFCIILNCMLSYILVVHYFLYMVILNVPLLTLSIFKMHVINVNIVFVWAFDVHCGLMFLL